MGAPATWFIAFDPERHYKLVQGDACPEHRKTLVPASTPSGQWQRGKRDRSCEFRQMVCPHRLCWWYAIEKRRPARGGR